MYLEELAWVPYDTYDIYMPKKECWLKRFFKKVKKVLNKETI